MDGNDIAQRRQAIESLEASMRSSQMAQMQSTQLKQMQDSQRQLMEMQQNLARTQEQSRFNLFGAGNGMAAMGAAAQTGMQQIMAQGPVWTATPTPSQSFLGLLGTGYVAPGIQSLSGGALFPSAGFQFGSTPEREIARSRDEMSFRMSTGLRLGLMDAFRPDFIQERSATFGEEATRVGQQRRLRGRMESFRGADRAALTSAGDALPGGFGVRLQGLGEGTEGVSSAINAIRDQYGAGSISMSQAKLFAEASNDLLGTSEGVNAYRSGGKRGVGEAQGSIITALKDLTFVLRANEKQTIELTKEFKSSVGSTLGVRGAQVAGAAIAAGTSTTGLSAFETAKVIGNPAMQRAAAMGYDPAGSYLTSSIREFSQTMADHQAGLITDTQMARFGGGEDFEMGARRAQHQQGVRSSGARRTMGFFGVLPGGYVSDNLFDTIGRVGSAYMSNQYVGQEASQSRERTQLAEQAFLFNTFTTANQISAMSGQPESASIARFGAMNSELDPIQAAAEYESMKKRVNRIKPLLGSRSGATLTGMLRLEDRARSAGLDPFGGVDASLGTLYDSLGSGPVSEAELKVASAIGAPRGSSLALASKLMDSGGDGNMTGGQLSELVTRMYKSGQLSLDEATKIAGLGLDRTGGFVVASGQGGGYDPVTATAEVDPLTGAISNSARRSGKFRNKGLAISGSSADTIESLLADALGGSRAITGGAFGRFMESTPGEYREVLREMSAKEGASLSENDLDIITGLAGATPAEMAEGSGILRDAFTNEERTHLRRWMFSGGSTLNAETPPPQDGSSEKPFYVRTKGWDE